ncbi:MAG: Xaa-Pro peptidase family protein [Candidatus Eisenbacteria bacterium]|nr:Xaa-Pro peptidase family protein [Candidatus Eisenbacteria bacterium]
MVSAINIRSSEFQARVSRLLHHVRAERMGGVVLFDNYYILYFTGFAFIPTERPVAFVMNAKGEQAMFVPRLEVEHAKSETGFERVDYYVEYPCDPHPAQVLKRILREMGVGGRIASDSDGYPWILGYRGPSLTELTGGTFVRVTGFVEDMMMIKSEAEIALIRESVKWGNLAHRLLQRYTKVGATETEVSMRASNEATVAMLDTLGPLYRAQSVFSEGAGAGYRGQIGRNAAIPHALANNITFQPGDVLVTGAGVPMWGYGSELERTMIVGRPSDNQRRMFEHMKKVQEVAFDALRPGARCSDVDAAVRKYYESNDVGFSEDAPGDNAASNKKLLSGTRVPAARHVSPKKSRRTSEEATPNPAVSSRGKAPEGLMRFWKHHTGHAIGLRYHEGPFLDIGDKTVIKPGMVFTVEPGLYASEMGGFRHSDTVVVTGDGIEILTYYPRDLDSLIIPV